VGVAKLLSGLVTWSLVTLDQVPPVEVSGEFHPEGLTEDLSTDWAGDFTAGREDEILQWAGGTSNRIAFRARFWRDHFLDDIASKVALVKGLVAKDPLLGRPPTVLFTVGADIAVNCVVESVGGIRYGKPRLDGFIREVIFDIALRRYTEFSIDAIDPTAPVSESRVYYAKRGDTFEQVAFHEYNSPAHGPYLRKRSKLYELTFGDKIHIYPKRATLRKDASERYSIPFAQDDETDGVRRTVIEKHDSPYRAHFLSVDL